MQEKDPLFMSHLFNSYWGIKGGVRFRSLPLPGSKMTNMAIDSRGSDKVG